MLVVLVVDGHNTMFRMFFFLVLDLTVNANFWLTELSLKKKTFTTFLLLRIQDGDSS
jgi:hypothetical protein